MKRCGMVTRLKPEGYENYKRLHASPWPEVRAMIKACHIRNYSIYYRDGLMFSYFEYTGSDFEADMARMAADKTTQEWWAACTPHFDPFEPGMYWSAMEELCHLD